MRVLDASVVTDALAVTGPDGDFARRLLTDESWLQAPAVLGAEVTSALRAMVRRGDLGPAEARTAAIRVARIRSRRYPFEPFVARAWELRDNLTIYDAWYVASPRHSAYPWSPATLGCAAPTGHAARC